MVSQWTEKIVLPGRLTLLLLWGVQVSLVVMLALFNPNHFTTVDSGYYLTSAQFLLDGKGYVYEDGGQLIWNGIFPLGYPLLIAVVAFLTQLPVLWASKLVNLLASAGLLYFVQKEFNFNKAMLMAALLLLGPFIKLWAHTWSEPVFLTLLFIWTYHFFTNRRRYLLTFGLGLALILVRYAGLFIVPLAAATALYWYFTNQRRRAYYSFILSWLWLSSFAGYLWLNYVQTGQWYGGDRLSGRESLIQVLGLFGRGLLNELFLLRDTFFESGDVLFWLGAGLQCILAGLILREILKNRRSIRIDSSPPITYYGLTAIIYLLFLFVLRLVSPFDPPGYRLLSPFSFLLLWGGLVRIAPYLSINRVKWLTITLLLASWLHLLPQTNVLEKLSNALR